MAGNPQVAQGTLNRLRGNVVIPSNPSLNVAPWNLGENGMSLSFGGNVVDAIPTLTGIVTSPAPYVMATLTIPLLKTQNIADAYKKQMESLATIGDITVYTDSTTYSQFDLVNCSIEKIDNFAINGKDATVGYSITGAWQVNSQLYSLV